MPKPIEYDKGFRVNFAHGGMRYQRRFPAHKFSDAKQAAKDYIDKVRSGAAIGERVRVKDAIERYLSWAHKTGQKKESTLQTDRQRLRVFLGWADSQHITYIGSVTVIHVRAFQEYFLDNHPFYQYQVRQERNPHSTWDRYRAILSALFRWSVDRDLMETNPVAGRKEFSTKKQEPLPRWFSDEDLEKLFAYLDEKGNVYVKAFYRLLAYTGLRLSEATQLKVRNLDLKEKTIIVTGQTKNYRNRSVPINEKLLTYLKALPRGKPNQLVFRNKEGGPYCIGNVWYRRLQRALTHLEIPLAGLHAFRHTFGAGLARGGAHPKVIQELMGHADYKMSMRYTHFAPRHLRESVSRLPF
jgi:integrase